MFVPFCQCAVQCAALGIEQRLIGRLLRQDMLEPVGQSWLRRFEFGKILNCQGTKLLFQDWRIGGYVLAAGVAQWLVVKNGPDHRSDFEGKLILQREPIDARQQEAMQRVRQQLFDSIQSVGDDL